MQLAGAALIMALLSACSAADGGGVDSQPAPAAVSLVRVGEAATVVAVATGTVRLRRETPLAFVNAGRVRSISVREGDFVRSGQPLAALDTTAIDAATLSAGVEYRRANAELARQQRLLSQGWVARARVDTAEAVASAAAAGLSSARFSQRFAGISAPGDGIVLARLAEPGQTLAAGSPALVLGELASGYVLRIPLSAGDVGRLSVGQTATVNFSDGAAPDMAATVIEIAGRADPQTGTFVVELALPTGAGINSGLKSGMIGQARIAQGQSGALTVPASAVFSARADEGFVWRYERVSKKVAARLVSLGAVSEQGVEVLGGLVPGDLIVRSGVDQLVEGQTVKPVAGLR